MPWSIISAARRALNPSGPALSTGWTRKLPGCSWSPGPREHSGCPRCSGKAGNLQGVRRAGVRRHERAARNHRPSHRPPSRPPDEDDFVHAPRGRESRTEWFGGNRLRRLDAAARGPAHRAALTRSRVHLSAQGRPIVGDTLYGGSRPIRIRQRRRSDHRPARPLLLHARRLRFFNPWLNREMEFPRPRRTTSGPVPRATAPGVFRL